MSSVRQKNTKPEMIVRSALHRLGYRFRLHYKRLPGTPDIVLPKRKLAIFVHGCFWHQHRGCHKSRRPSSNSEYWGPKLDENMRRDKDKIIKIRLQGWKVLVIWECQTRSNEIDNILQKELQ